MCKTTGAAIVAIGVGLIMVIAFMGVTRRTSRQPVPTHTVIMCFDRSGSARAGLPASVLAAARIMTTLNARHTTVICYRMDRACTEFYAGKPLHSREATTELLIQYLKELPEDMTYPALFWEEMASRFGHLVTPITIVCFTDGENDDQSLESRRAIRDAAAILARNEFLRVMLVGLYPETRKEARNAFAAFGDRLTLTSFNDCQISTPTMTAH